MICRLKIKQKSQKSNIFSDLFEPCENLWWTRDAACSHHLGVAPFPWHRLLVEFRRDGTSRHARCQWTCADAASFAPSHRRGLASTTRTERWPGGLERQNSVFITCKMESSCMICPGLGRKVAYCPGCWGPMCWPGNPPASRHRMWEAARGVGFARWSWSSRSEPNCSAHYIDVIL